MSRCFPYPPPGYEKSAALIESIKKERLKSEKEKKKEKRSKSKSEEKKHRNRKRHREDSSKSTIDKLTADEDRSSLTEEHVSPAVSRDSRKKIRLTFEPPTQEQEIKKQEDKKALDSSLSESVRGGIKIRLPIPREEEPPAAVEQPCFSGRPNEERRQQQEPGFSGRQTEEVKEKKRKRKSCDESSSSRDWDKQRRRLIKEWSPPPLVPPKEDDLDWLFGAGAPARRKDLPPLPPPVVIVDGTICRATYIPEAGIFALPYAVPF